MKYMKQNSVKLNRFEPLASPMEAPAAVWQFRCDINNTPIFQTGNFFTSTPT
jgi:hypothetical protein